LPERRYSVTVLPPCSAAVLDNAMRATAESGAM
jgi:hypothetical protein